MKKIFLILFTLLFVWSCGDSTMVTEQDPMNEDTDTTIDAPQNTTTDPVDAVVPDLPDAPEPPVPNMSNTLSNNASAAASGFCESQKQLQILSTSLISAFSRYRRKSSSPR